MLSDGIVDWMCHWWTTQIGGGKGVNAGGGRPQAAPHLPRCYYDYVTSHWFSRLAEDGRAVNQQRIVLDSLESRSTAGKKVPARQETHTAFMTWLEGEHQRIGGAPVSNIGPIYPNLSSSMVQSLSIESFRQLLPRRTPLPLWVPRGDPE